MLTYVAYATTTGYAGSTVHNIEILEPGLLGSRVVCTIPDNPGVNEYGELDAEYADLLLVEHGWRRVYDWRKREEGLWVALVCRAEDE
jgi:hypothetical protein